MVSDGLSIMNAEFSSTSFRVSQAALGARSFLGNDIAYPPRPHRRQLPARDEGHGARSTGDVGRASGSRVTPASRSRGRSSATARSTTWRERGTAPPARAPRTGTTRSPSRCTCWRGGSTSSVVAAGLLAADLYDGSGRSASPLSSWSRCSPGVYVLLERAATGFRPLRPQFCSIYEPLLLVARALLEVQRPAYLAMFNGTPFKNVIWRLLGFGSAGGLRRRLRHTGEDARHDRRRLHAQRGQRDPVPLAEDGTFKSDHTVLGAGCTLGDGLRALRRDDGRRRRARRRLLPHEGRGGRPARRGGAGNLAQQARQTPSRALAQAAVILFNAQEEQT